MRSSALLVTFVGVALAACQSGTAKKAEASATPQPPPAETEALLEQADFGAPSEAPPRPLLILGMTRPIGQKEAIAGAQLLNEYLSKEIGGEVTTRLYGDPNELGDALAAGQIDAAWMTPIAYVRAKERASVDAVACMNRGGFTSYRSVIFVKAGSKVKKLADLKGKRMGWVKEGSASGRAFPRAHLKRLDKDPAVFFKASVDHEDHKAVCQAVLEGTVDAGASLSDVRPEGEAPIVDGCREAGFDPAQFRIVEQTGVIPNDVIVVRSDLPSVVYEKAKSALLSMNASEAGRAQLKEIFRADGFAAVTDEAFAPVREVQMLLELK